MRIINTHREPVPPAKVLTEDEILSLCCKVVPVDECSEVGRVGVYDGADEKHRNFDEDEALARARAAYPKARILKVQVEGIGPPPGTPCGKLYESWIGRNNCCEGVPSLAWNMDITPDVLPHGKSIIIAWNGSDSRQVELSTSSNGTWFSDGRRTAVGYGSSIELKASETFCGNTAVTVNDGCTEATVVIRSDLGQWVSLGDQCGLPGASWKNVGNYNRQAIVGSYKQTETVSLEHWYAPGLQCITPGYVPRPEYEASCHSGDDCPEWYCAKVTAVQPPEAFTDTCLAPDLMSYMVASVTLHCSQSDGTIIVMGPDITFFSCVWMSGASGFGTKQMNQGFYAKTTSKNLYKWQC